MKKFHLKKEVLKPKSVSAGEQVGPLFSTTCCRIFETKTGGILIYAWPVASSKIHGLLGWWIQPVLSKIRQFWFHMVSSSM
jgi:hypothetical protein